MSARNPRDPRLPFDADKCRCSACGEYFNSTYAFDAHRIGRADDRRCLSAKEMRERGFSVNATGHWITQTRDAGDAIGTDPYSPQGVAA